MWPTLILALFFLLRVTISLIFEITSPSKMGIDAAAILPDERVSQHTATLNGQTYRKPCAGISLLEG